MCLCMCVISVVNIIEAYYLEKRVCIVMPLYRHTLLDLLRFPEDAPDENSKSQEEHFDSGGNPSDIIVPRYVGAAYY